jgi:hypothetical protein
MRADETGRAEDNCLFHVGLVSQDVGDIRLIGETSSHPAHRRQNSIP